MDKRYLKMKSLCSYSKESTFSLREMVVVGRRLLGLFLIAGFLFSCGGKFSKKPPLHPNLNMDNQPKRKSQTLPLLLPLGVVPYGVVTNPYSKSRIQFAKPHAGFFYGLYMEKYMEITPEITNKIRKAVMDKNSPEKNEIMKGIQFTPHMPIPVNKRFIMRGFRNFQAHCAMCHGARGLGNGLIVERRVGMPPPPSFVSKSSMALSDGKIFNIITHGRPEYGMPGHAERLYEIDRWAIVLYIRTLQRSMNGREEDIPKENRE